MAGIQRNSSVTTNLGDLIQLPRFDAAGAMELGEALLAVAGPSAELPHAIGRARDMLEEDLATLRRAAASRLAAAGATDPVATAADRALDASWTALHDWLAAFAKLPEGSFEHGEASALLDELYPDGLSFILLPYEIEWEQSERRLARIATEPLGDRIRKLGGGVFLEVLGASHAAYGKALGLPRPPGEKGNGEAGVAEALDAFVSTLRRYALKVTAHVEIGEPHTADLARKLLGPLFHYQARARG